MAERSDPRQVQVHPQRYDPTGFKGEQKRPSASKVLAVITLLPVGGGLLALAGIILVGTLIGMAITTPLFVIFSPILVPVAFVFGLAVMAFLASGAFGLTGLSSLSWVVKYLREATRAMPQQLDLAKRRMQDMAGIVGQKTKEVGQEIQRKAHDAK